MFLDLRVGNIIEPTSGRRMDRARIERELSLRVAYLQAQGLVRSDRVFLHYGNTAAFFVDLLAVWFLGGCAVPVDPRLTQFEIETLARAARPTFSLWNSTPDAAIAKRLAPLGTRVLQISAEWEDVGPLQPQSYPTALVSLDAPALILFTSGTTGAPKGVVHTHRTLRARWMSLRQSLDMKHFQRTLCMLPTHFGHGLICNCLFPWLSGQDIYVAPPFRGDLLMQLGALLDEHRITFMSSVPSIWQLALRTARRPRSGSLQQIFCGSAPLSAHLWQEIREWSGTGNVVNAYGITEVGSWVAGTTVPEVALEDGLVGVPWGAVIRILKSSDTGIAPGFAAECPAGEPGYVWLNTPALMQGYLDRDDLTAQVVSAGWFCTGDIGLLDQRGILYLRGREREEINKGGMKIYPSDIETIVEQYEHTLDVCTFAYEEALHGENIATAVVLEEPIDRHFRGLYEFVSQRLAQFQMPQRWYLVDEIPRSSRGKVNRRQIGQTFSERKPLDHIAMIRGYR
jgi:acyl-CoA synthetase (AMP-forming)/AMP-acid ligase II